MNDTNLITPDIDSNSSRPVLSTKDICNTSTDIPISDVSI